MANLTLVGTPVVQGTAPDSVTLRVEYPPQYSDALGRSAIAVYVGSWTAATGWRDATNPSAALVLPGAGAAGDPVPLCTLTETVMYGGLPRPRSWTARLYDNSAAGNLGTAGTFDYTFPQTPQNYLGSLPVTPGPAGPPGAVNNPRGAYSAGATYQKGDLVGYQNRAFVALATLTGVTPPASATSTASWMLANDVGPTGPANTLAIGAVTTGAPGSAAAASLTGSAPSQTLNLTLPAGSSTNPRGAYSAGATYNRLDVVTTPQGRSFVALATLTGVAPPTTAASTANWQLLADKGADGTGTGDMARAVYDTDSSGVVDNAEKLGGQPPSAYASAAHDHARTVLVGQTGGTVGKFVRLTATANTWADASNTDGAASLALVGYKLDSGSVVLSGYAGGLAGLTVGQPVYLALAGGYTQTAPTPGGGVALVLLGQAMSTTEVLLEPNPPVASSNGRASWMTPGNYTWVSPITGTVWVTLQAGGGAGMANASGAILNGNNGGDSSFAGLTRAGGRGGNQGNNNTNTAANANGAGGGGNGGLANLTPFSLFGFGLNAGGAQGTVYAGGGAAFGNAGSSNWGNVATGNVGAGNSGAGYGGGTGSALNHTTNTSAVTFGGQGGDAVIRSPVQVVAGQSYAVTVGAGGLGVTATQGTRTASTSQAGGGFVSIEW